MLTISVHLFLKGYQVSFSSFTSAWSSLAETLLQLYTEISDTSNAFCLSLNPYLFSLNCERIQLSKFAEDWTWFRQLLLVLCSCFQFPTAISHIHTQIERKPSVKAKAQDIITKLWSPNSRITEKRMLQFIGTTNKAATFQKN